MTPPPGRAVARGVLAVALAVLCWAAWWAGGVVQDLLGLGVVDPVGRFILVSLALTAAESVLPLLRPKTG